MQKVSRSGCIKPIKLKRGVLFHFPKKWMQATWYYIEIISHNRKSNHQVCRAR